MKPKAGTDAYRAYMNTYMKARWKRRRADAVALLGGKCVVCGCDDTDTLEFDHIDPKTKLFTIAKGSSFSGVRFWAEVRKTQLLCGGGRCHLDKTLPELGRKRAECGTYAKYKHHKCRCQRCRRACAEYTADYRRRKGRVYKKTRE